MIILDLKDLRITGDKIEKVLEACSILVNKNSIRGDTSVFSPSGIRLGTAALTSRTFKSKDFIQIGSFVNRAIKIGLNLLNQCEDAINFDHIRNNSDIINLKQEIEIFSMQFPVPGHM